MKYAAHKGVQQVVADVAGIYLADAMLSKNDFNPTAFDWINADDSDNSVFSFLRYDYAGQTCYAVVSNFTPVLRSSYEIGLPWLGRWREVINTDAKCYGGGGSGNGGYVDAVEKEAFGKPFSAKLVLPPLSTLILRCDRESPDGKKA